MTKHEIEEKLLDATPEELTEISDFFSTKIGKQKSPDPAKMIEDKLNEAAQGWEERDGKYVCKNTCKGRLCMRKDLVQDKEVVEKKPDTVEEVEKLLSPGEWLKKEPKTDLEKRLAAGTASEAEKVADLLSPDWMKEEKSE